MRAPAALLLLVSVGVAAAESCCSTHKATVPMNTSDASDVHCDAARPLEYWDPRSSLGDGSHWMEGNKPTWLSFAGDSELRYEFWTLVRMIGQDKLTSSDNFARVGFNASDQKAVNKFLHDGDPVTVEAKYMDYRFCCRSPSNPASCHIETGGDNVTKLHAGYRKVDHWVATMTDFTDIGAAVSDYLERNQQGLCITWKMIAYPIPEVIYPLLHNQLSQPVKPKALVLNPGLHHLCFKGNKRGSEGHRAHLNGFQLLNKLVPKYRKQGVDTRFIMHNVMWANEQGLFDAFAARNIMDKAETFRGLEKGIVNWNKDAKNILDSKTPFDMLDLYAVSVQLKQFIKKDHVHYEPPMYNAALTYDLNIMMGFLKMCREF